MSVTARKAYINKIDGLYPALSFSRLPMTYEEREKTEAAINEQHQIPRKCQVIFAAIKNKLVEWDARPAHQCDVEDTDSRETPLPLSLQSIKSLEPRLIDKLYLILVGKLPSDPLPDASEEEHDTLADEIIRAAEHGTDVGVEDERATVKN